MKPPRRTHKKHECGDCEQNQQKLMNAVNMKLISSVCGLLIFAGTLSASVVDDRAPRFIKSNAVTRVKRSASGSVDLVRHRRQAQTLTTDQKQEILDRHNTLRRTEGASDMELLVRTRVYCLHNRTDLRCAFYVRFGFLPERDYRTLLSGICHRKSVCLSSSSSSSFNSHTR